MRKILIAFLSIFLISSLSSCKKQGIDYNGEYRTYLMYTEDSNLEEIFGIEDTKTIIINTQKEYEEINKKVFNYQGELAEFIDIDFSINKLAVTAAYIDHSNADISVLSIKENENTIYQDVEISINTPAVSNNIIYLLYLVLDKNTEYKIETEFNTKIEYNRYVCYKPIVYFYPEEEMYLEIRYKNDFNLLTTYPKYNNGWRFNIKQNGSFTTSESCREYYALYFDELANYTCDFNEGFYVDKDDALSFLEEKLDMLGYSQREANEFIMYWLPVLESNEKSMVYFEQTKERNLECPLEFSTQPDSVLRTIIHIKKVESDPHVPQQTLESFDRFGFSVVEWGGVTY